MTQSVKLDAISVYFGEFWLRVAADLGNSRIRISDSAKTIHEFIDKDSDCKRYLLELIKRSYKLSKCQHLGSPLRLELVLDLLGETAYQLQNDQTDDLFDIELLEEIAWHICSRYSAQISFILENSTAQPSKASQAQIISFPNYKIWRSNIKL
ncbi:MAG: hypothetical protein ACI9LU_001857 [Polaribacter sp.]|jgi:hypothetical protein